MQTSQKEANSHEPSQGFHTCIERLCFCKRELAFLCFVCVRPVCFHVCRVCHTSVAAVCSNLRSQLGAPVIIQTLPLLRY